jgi:hypothetical protein
VGWKAFSGLLASVLFLLLGWHVNTSFDRIAYLEQHARDAEIALAAIAANRFTAQDGQAILDRIVQVQARVSAIPTEVPPKWFYDRVAKLETLVEQLDSRCDAIEQITYNESRERK